MKKTSCSKSKKSARRNSRIFAPLDTPLSRRLETAAVLFHLTSIPFFLSLVFILIYIAIFIVSVTPRLVARCLLVVYSLYYVKDFKRPFRGRICASRCLRKILSPWLNAYRRYFPIVSLLTPEAERVLTALTDDPRPLLFGSHPHGIVSIGTVTSFALDPYWLLDRFPHVSVNLLTLNMNMIWPFWRDWLMSFGCASVDKISCERILKRTGTDGRSHGIVIVVGGAREALDATPGRMDLTLNSRNGFFKLALNHGALLFPILCFGENDIYDQLESPVIRFIQHSWYRLFGFSTPFFFGRGLFNYRFGWLPRRVPITLIVGEPIDVGQPRASIKDDEVRQLRNQYIQRLTDLYNRYKDQYEVVACPNGLRVLQ